MIIELTVNGQSRTVTTHPMARLLDLIRDDLSLKGCKEGCGEGECGACSIIMNGLLVNACMIPAIQAAGAELLTIEGLGGRDNPDLLQRAFIDEGAVHCGFCTPGMILAARALLADTSSPSRLEIKTALSGNLCRCTGYSRIYAAVDKAIAHGYNPVKTGNGSKSKPEYAPDEQGRFFTPSTLQEALAILEQHPDVLILAGGTDTGAKLKTNDFQPHKAMDIFSLPELHAITVTKEAICIGACVTNTQFIESEIIRKHLPALHQAAAACAAPAVRNRATVGGNFCTASGAADLPVPLYALGAKARVLSSKGQRILEAPEFIQGYRKPNLEAGELLVEFIIPIPPRGARQVFYKRGSRAALTLSRASLALYVELTDGVITQSRAAAGSMSPTPIRLPKLEAALIGNTLDAELIATAASTLREELTPRRSAQYRKALSSNLVQRFLGSILQE